MKRRVARYIVEWVKRKHMDVWGFQERLQDLGARHSVPSGLLSIDDAPGQTSERLLEVALAAVSAARSIQFSRERFADRPAMPFFFNQWPGEHYRLLAGFCQILGVQNAVEIGTFTGLSALAIRDALPLGGKLVTFDVVPWNEFTNTYLTERDFAQESLKQEIADLSDSATAMRHAETLRRADLLFIDAAKDGVQEQKFLDNFEQIGLKPGAVLIFDDTRLLSMLSIWRNIRRPKLDLTSFGHFTGTGVVDWS